MSCVGGGIWAADAGAGLHTGLAHGCWQAAHLAALPAVQDQEEGQGPASCPLR